MRTIFRKATVFTATKRELFELHEREDAFSLLTPASENVEVQSTASTLAPSDDVVRFTVHFGPLKFRFENIHTIYEPYDLFVDEQRKGLFTLWRHEHRFMEAGWKIDPSSMLTDEITYSHPLLRLFNPFVRHRLSKLFEFRHQVTAEELGKEGKPESTERGETCIVTGATGLIGRKIVQVLSEKGYHVIAFARNVEKAGKLLGEGITCVHWDFTRPDEGEWKDYLSRADSVIHLAGTPLFKQRWTAEFKRELEESRILGTRQLVDAITASDKKPSVFVSASALGYYGNDPDKVVDESAPPAEDLLARICVNWENEAKKLDNQSIRTVQIRIGIALSTESGALKEILPVFRLGIGGTMGDPRPYMNWIHIEDLARIFVMALKNDKMRGPFNAAGPNPVTNAAFAGKIAQTLGRPALMKFPVPLLKIIIGEAADYASGGPKVEVGKLREAGYRFFFEDLGLALENLLKR